MNSRNITPEQFSTFNVAFSSHYATEYPLLGDAYQQQAKAFLDRYRQFRAYLEWLDGPWAHAFQPYSGDEDLAQFKVPHIWQQIIVKHFESEKPGPIYGRDEIINIALISFLDMLCLPIPGNAVFWRWKPAAFRDMPFRKGEITSEFGGCLMSKHDEQDLYTILDTRLTMNLEHESPVARHKAAAEMICWILYDNRPGNERQSKIPK